MTTTCIRCESSRTTTVDSRPISNGGRRRRHHCHICSHRWTTYVDRRGRLIDAPPRLRPKKATGRQSKQRRLRPDQARLILESPHRSLNSLAAELGVSRECVRLVRIGLTYTEVCPHIRRRSPRPRETPEVSCLRCLNWVEEQCVMGFPDPIEEGPDFAVDCDHFSPRKEL